MTAGHSTLSSAALYRGPFVAMAAMLLITACTPNSGEDKKRKATACEADAYNAADVGQLNIAATVPTDCASGVQLSLSQVTITFDKPIATNYDGVNFIWPHLAAIEPYLLLEDLSAGVPADFFLDRDFADDKTLVLYLGAAPVAQHQYRLVAVSGLTSEAGVPLAGDRQVQFTLGGSMFGGLIYANRVIDYSPEVPGGATLGEGRYVAASILGQLEGSLHTTSLGDNGSGVGGSITVGFGDAIGGTPHCIVDGVGDDFLVKENVFAFSDTSGAQSYTEAAFVEVSQDNLTFYRFSNNGASVTTGFGNPASYSGLAGIAAGGDRFDLHEAIVAHSLLEDFRACYVRLVDGGATVMDYDHDGDFQTWDGSGSDVDAIQALNSVAVPSLVDP